MKYWNTKTNILIWKQDQRLLPEEIDDESPEDYAQRVRALIATWTLVNLAAGPGWPPTRHPTYWLSSIIRPRNRRIILGLIVSVDSRFCYGEAWMDRHLSSSGFTARKTDQVLKERNHALIGAITVHPTTDSHAPSTQIFICHHARYIQISPVSQRPTTFA